MAENVNIALQAITTVGFPIVACCVMFWMLSREQAQHKEESEKWIQALDKNTAVIEKLLEKMK